MKMKRIYYLIAVAALAVVSSCHEPEFVEPTAERQGITSLTAYFTSGKYVEKEAGKLTVKDGEDLDIYEIPIAYYYPEKSDDVTTLHMNRMRVRAELAPNCKIDPPLTVLDLNVENKYKYTNAYGETKDIIITGKRVPFKTAKLLTFDLVDAPENGRTVVTGFVDNAAKVVYLFSIDDLSGLYLNAKPWYHASIKDYEELSSKPSDWNEDRIVTAIAHDGETMQDYKILKREPSKIKYGFNTPALEEDELGYWGLFSIDPFVEYGSNIPHYDVPVITSIAYVDGYVVLNHHDCPDDGFEDGAKYTPIYVDGQNGSFGGLVNTGDLTEVGAVTNDEGGNMLMCNYLSADGGVLNIYRTSSVTDAPELFYTFENIAQNDLGETVALVSLPLGSQIKVCGDIDGDATIVMPFEGISGITEASQFLNINVVGGDIVSCKVIQAEGVAWGQAPLHSSGLVPTNAAGDNGWFLGQHYYNGFDGLRWIRPDMQLGNILASNIGNNDWLIRAGCLDSKNFNGATYMAHFALHYFPGWAEQPSLWVYDIGDPATVAGKYQESSSIVAYDSWVEHYGASTYQDTRSCGDVVMAPSADGLRLFIYCYDHYANVLCCYAADCVKRK